MNKEENLTQEKALWICIKDAYAEMDTSKSFEEQLNVFLDAIHLTESIENQFDNFLTDIKLATDLCVIKNLFMDCFKIACKMPYGHITNTRVVLKVETLYPKILRRHIRLILNDVFRDWLVGNHELHEAYPKMSFMLMLKVFAKHQQAEG